jgi:hypothetical protein
MLLKIVSVKYALSTIKITVMLCPVVLLEADEGFPLNASCTIKWKCVFLKASLRCAFENEILSTEFAIFSYLHAKTYLTKIIKKICQYYVKHNILTHLNI